MKELDDLAKQIVPDTSIVDSVMARIATTSMVNRNNLQLRKWIMRTSLGLAACCLLAFVLLTATRPHTAFANVLDKVSQTHTLSFTILEDPGDKESIRVTIKGDLLRADMGSGVYTIMNRNTGQVLMVDPKKQTATRTTFARQPFDFYATLKDFKNGKEERLGEKDFAGKKLLGFKVTRDFPDTGGDTKPQTLTLWVDPATDLPVRAEAPPEHGEKTPTNLENLTFDAPVDDAIFSMATPAAYKEYDMGGISSDHLKPPPTTQEAADLLTITPNVGIGQLKFGATKEEVIKILGQPEQSTRGFDLGYPSKGLALLVHPKAGLSAITVFSKQALGPFAANEFKGRTDKGITIHSTRADIEKAYGAPTSTQGKKGARQAVLEYKPLHMTIVLLDDHVAQIMLQKPSTLVAPK